MTAFITEASWQPIETAPKDGTVIWAWLFETGIRRLRWMGPQECAEYEGRPSEVEDYDGVWVEDNDLSEDWTPRWWLPFSAIPEPPQ